MKFIWMKVTKDQYRLPLAVASSAVELARICGTTANAVFSSVCLWKKGKYPLSPYIRVEDDEENEADRH